MKKVLVLHSGGLDSTVILYKAVRTFGNENVFALNAFYGQKHSKEMEYSQWQCEHLGVKNYIVDLSSVFTFNKNCSSLLQDSEDEIEYGTYEEQLKDKKQVSTYVPYRNGLLLSYATAVAIQLGCSIVMYGAHADDAVGGAYPDCTKDFIDSQSWAIKHGTANEVELEAPLWNKNKSEVVKLGLGLGMTKNEFGHTWSCYEGGEKPCGQCATCQDRKKALESNGIFDVD